MQVAPFGSIQSGKHHAPIVRTFLLDQARAKQRLVAAEDRRGLSYIIEFHVRSSISRAVGGSAFANREDSTNGSL